MGEESLLEWIHRLIDALEEGNADVIQLSEMSYEHSVASLIQKLTDEDPNIRIYAAFALARIREPRAIEPLISVLDDHSLSRPYGRFVD